MPSNPVSLAADGTDVSDKIQHIFVLMMENRSFDHVFGRNNYYGPQGLENLYSVLNSPKPGESWIDQSLVERKTGSHSFADAIAGDCVTPDPPHEMEDVYYQLAGKSPWSAPPNVVSVLPVPYSYAGVAKPCSGFLDAYLATPEIAKLTKPVDPIPVMASWDPMDTPVLTSLAREYALCDHWFSSIPGPTWPNRLFVHAGHSGGLDFSPGTGDCTEKLLLEGYDLGKSVFDLLPGKAAIYSDGAIPLVMALKGICFDGNSSAPVRPLHDFEDDLANGKIAERSYTFVEPNYGDALGTDVINEYAHGNSQHAVASFHAGEALIARIYNAIRGSALWEKSLFIITWDEHGGFFDHVPPPTSPDFVPTGTMEYSHHQFAFDTLGVRVPALFISPYVKKGVVESQVHDHSVIPNFISQWFTNASLPQGRQPKPGGVTGLNAQNTIFDWSQTISAARLPNVGTSRPDQTLSSPPTQAPGPGETASRTVQSRVLLSAISITKGRGNPTPEAARATVAKVKNLKTRTQHLKFIANNTPKKSKV